MNVFENLIDELRDDNLLEETILDNASVTEPGLENVDIQIERGEAAAGTSESFDPLEDPAEFYRKRAMDEVSSLQMVEHMISAIEREYLKAVPVPYDDLEAKKALHKFIQVSGQVDSVEYSEAEYALLHETESWSTALATRDERLSAMNLRMFCENSRPPLSSQALMALGRFYRNAQFSEASRAKFDVVMTRLFSKESDDEKRRPLFSPAESVGHIRTLYASWSSVAYSSADEDGTVVRPAAAKFTELAAEAEGFQTFDDLIRTDFFGRLRACKEAIGEIFFAPEVTAAALDCNIRVGNRFVDLIQGERTRASIEKIEERYGYTYDQVISDAAGKTLHLVDLLKGFPEAADSEFQPVALTAGDAKSSAAAAKGKSRSALRGALSINKWLLAATLFAALLSVGIYFWSDSYESNQESIPRAKQIDLANTELAPHLRSGRATNTTFYAVTDPSWEKLTSEEQREVLDRAVAYAEKLKLNRVEIVNFKGRTIAYSTGDRQEIVKP